MRSRPRRVSRSGRLPVARERLGAPLQAVAFLQQALEVAADDADRAGLMEQAGQAAVVGSRADLAVDAPRGGRHPSRGRRRSSRAGLGDRAARGGSRLGAPSGGGVGAARQRDRALRRSRRRSALDPAARRLGEGPPAQRRVRAVPGAGRHRPREGRAPRAHRRRGELPGGQRHGRVLPGTAVGGERAPWRCRGSRGAGRPGRHLPVGVDDAGQHHGARRSRDVRAAAARGAGPVSTARAALDGDHDPRQRRRGRPADR